MKRPLKEQNNNGIPDEKAAELVWEDYLKSNRSIIVHLFAGQHKSSLLCTSCQKESVMFEPFFNLSLPIPPSKTHCNIRVRFLFSSGNVYLKIRCHGSINTTGMLRSLHEIRTHQRMVMFVLQKQQRSDEKNRHLEVAAGPSCSP